jgi:hypothetical protein
MGGAAAVGVRFFPLLGIILSPSRTHTHIHTYTLSLTHTLSLSHTHTHTPVSPHKHVHTRTHTHTHKDSRLVRPLGVECAPVVELQEDLPDLHGLGLCVYACVCHWGWWCAERGGGGLSACVIGGDGVGSGECSVCWGRMSQAGDPFACKLITPRPLPSLPPVAPHLGVARDAERVPLLRVCFNILCLCLCLC